MSRFNINDRVLYKYSDENYITRYRIGVIFSIYSKDIYLITNMPDRYLGIDIKNIASAEGFGTPLWRLMREIQEEE